ncbi:hypothetical protein LOD99_15611 [Oopsacas minuta]|uniref:Uncharacterized protein n=1 Tax=Oopsacas minuta TaxID=111878 RepID=A0AAV7KAQ2_9METZ|nr:hypothetical protein LOD99_15611 [Oopsacas minuta]
MILFITCYFIRGRYRVSVQLRNIPSSTILDIDLSKVKLNLKIESMVYAFLIILSSMELIVNVAGGINMFDTNDVPLFMNVYFPNISNSFLISDHAPMSNLALITLQIENITINLILPITCLYLIVLRRAYLNLPYKKWVIGYLIFIIGRLSLFVLLSLSIPLSYISQMMYFPFEVIDLCVYIPCCKSFYLLLKGRRDEARWHSNITVFYANCLIVKQFFYAQIFTSTCFVLLIIDSLILFYVSPIRIMLYFPSFIYKFSFGLFPTLTFSKQQNDILGNILKNSMSIHTAILIIIEISVSLVYVMVCVGIVLKFVRKQKQYNSVNVATIKPLMERYHATLSTPYRQYQQRPPFIQGFRSDLIY